MQKEESEVSSKKIDIYYLNRGVWLFEEVETTVLTPLFIIIIFQNFFATILSIILIVFLVYLNKKGFQYNTALRMISFFFKKEILPIDNYDYEYFRKRNLYKDGRFTSEEVSKSKIIINENQKEMKKLRL